MKGALKLVCVSQFFHTPSTTRYDVNDAQYLIDLLSTGMQEEAATETEAIDDSEIPCVEELPCFHIACAGALLRSLERVVFGGHFFRKLS